MLTTSATGSTGTEPARIKETKPSRAWARTSGAKSFSFVSRSAIWESMGTLLFSYSKWRALIQNAD
jgi:hypothetical protein